MSAITDDRSIRRGSAALEQSSNRVLSRKALVEEGAGKDNTETATRAKGEAILDYLVEEMLNNTAESSGVFKRLRDSYNKYASLSKDASVADTIAGAGALFDALFLFSNQVGYGKPWDQKAYILAKWGRRAIFWGVELEHDIWSNIHYGFVGSAVGFNDQLLKDAAGAVQAVWSNVPDDWLIKWLSGRRGIIQSLDDEVDQIAIETGIKIWHDGGRQNIPTRLRTIIRTHIGRLARIN